MRARATGGGFEVMEHREPPPIVAEDPRLRSVAPAASHRLALPPPERALSRGLVLARSRTALWFAIVLVVLLCSSLVYLASRTARSWLTEQPDYQLPFESIALDPPPPSWYR